MSGMLDVTHQADKPQDYTDQVFIGKVVVNDDIKKFHRIKVEIPDMWEAYTQEQLPWCMPDNLAGGSGPTETEQNIPETGSFVYITFQNGDNHFPIYHGGVRDYRTVKGVLDENYPHRIGWQRNSYTEAHSGTERKRTHTNKTGPTPYDVKVHHFYIDRSTNDVEYEHPTKTRIHIYPNGSIYMEVRDKKWPDGGDFKMDTDRDWVLNVGLAKSAGRPGNMIVDVVEGYSTLHVKQYQWEHIEGMITTIGDSNRQETITGNDTLGVSGSVLHKAGSSYTVISPTILLQGATTVDGTLHVTENMTGDANFDLTGNQTIGGNLDVGGSINSGGLMTGPTITDIYAKLAAAEAAATAAAGQIAGLQAQVAALTPPGP